jgi:tetratricopeptide (TPR) repeat protein
MTCKLSDLLFLSLLFAGGLWAQSADPLTSYKEANYKVAIPVLKAAIAADPKNALLHAALLSSLTYEGRVDEASDEADADEAAFPQSADVLAARGEFAYYMADMSAAEKLFKAAMKLKDDNARAWFGLARLFRSASYFRTGRLYCLKAHVLDPGDALITKSWLNYTPPEKRAGLLKEFAQAHPWLYKNFEMYEDAGEKLGAAVNRREEFQLEGGRTETDLHLVELRYSPQVVRGLGLEMSINGGRKLKLLLDTGASGILLSQTFIDKSGLDHLGTIEGRGVGDDGAKKGFLSVADTCEIGGLKFKTCVFRALEGKRAISGEFDGLIGTDTFGQYLIQIDFQKHAMNLKPLPERQRLPQGYDREVPPEEKTFTPVFRQGHHLLVTTHLNGEDAGLFLLDTGSGISMVDSTFASLSGKIHQDNYMRVKGISGDVKKVFEASKAEIQFATFRQRNLGMTAIDLNNSPDHQDVRMSGILGLPVLAMFRLTLDYRNGLVKFDPVFK